ncbi:MAG: hypothetical protein WCP58_07510 [bacterium]
MNNVPETPESIYQALLVIYEKHRRRYRNNPDSKQICCMWSTSSPPDTLEKTSQIRDIEKAFDIFIDEDSAVELYDMDLDEAARKIMEIQEGKC